MSLVIALGTVMLAMPAGRGDRCAHIHVAAVPLDARRCDIDRPQDCIVNTPPPFTPSSPPSGPRVSDPGANDRLPAARTLQPLRPQRALKRSGKGARYTKGFAEPYNEGVSDSGPGQRLVQYFDKGRMELTTPASGIVTNGLLANELITGQLQMGNTNFERRAPANIPIAGDPDNAGPTYAGLGTNGAALFAAATPHVPTERNFGAIVETRVAADGTVTTTQPNAGQGPMAISVYDDATQHNVPTAFAAYRDKVGLLTIGYAKSEAFLTTVRSAAQPTGDGAGLRAPRPHLHAGQYPGVPGRDGQHRRALLPLALLRRVNHWRCRPESHLPPGTIPERKCRVLLQHRCT